jgi:hypothetical protein
MAQLFAIGFVVIIVLWLFSKLSRSVLCNSILDTYGKQSTSIIFAMIAVISVWAVINTNGKTYLLFTLLIVMGIVVFSLKKNSSVQKLNKGDDNTFLVQLFVLYIVFFIIQLLKVVSLNDLTLRALHDDVAYSAGISDFLVKYHKETLILDPNSVYSWQPYHYFEMHFSALLSAITGFTSLKVLYLIVYPVLYAMSVSTIKEFLVKLNLNIGIGLILVVFITNGDWSNLLNDMFDVNILPDVSNINKVGTKLAIYPVIIIGLVNFVDHLRESTMITHTSFLNGLFLGLICFLYPTSIPVVLFLVAFTFGYFKLGNFYWKVVAFALFIILATLVYGSESLMDMVFLTHPIQYLIAYIPLIVILVITAYKLDFIKLKEINWISSLFVLLIGTWIFLVLLRFLGHIEFYNNPDSAQIYGNFTDEFVLMMILLVTCSVIKKISETKNTYKLLIFSTLLLGFVINQNNVFSFYHPMNSKALKLNNHILTQKVLIWDRDTNDFNINTSNWLIHFTIPYSNTRWECSNYFPLLRTLPKESQVTKTTQRYAYEGVVKKASNYNNDYFNNDNSILIENVIKSNIEKK